MLTLHHALSADGLEPMEETHLRRLINQYTVHQPANDLRTHYYLGKHSLRAAGKLGMAMPPGLARLETVLGWPAKAVTTLEHRLNLNGFVLPDQPTKDQGLSDIWADNNMPVEVSMTHTASLIHGTAFVTISAGDEASGEPPVLVQARSAREATCLWSHRRREIIAGLTVNAETDWEPGSMTLWLPDRVVILTKTRNSWEIDRRPHRLGIVPMVMLSFRPHLEREFGVPRISHTVMGLTDSAARTVLRMEGTAEFFSFPQRYAIGVEEDDFSDSFKTYLNRFLALGRDAEGNPPQMGEFTSSSPQPHIEQLRATAMLFSGETSIPLGYLGIVHDNPSSADAIRAAEADLITVAERAQSVYGYGWSTVMRIAQYIRDGIPDDNLRHLEVQWKDPATPTKAANAQSVMALVSAGVLPAHSEVTWELLGYDPATISRLKADTAADDAKNRLGQLLPTPAENDAQSAPGSGVEERLAKGESGLVVGDMEDPEISKVM